MAEHHQRSQVKGCAVADCSEPSVRVSGHIVTEEDIDEYLMIKGVRLRRSNRGLDRIRGVGIACLAPEVLDSLDKLWLCPSTAKDLQHHGTWFVSDDDMQPAYRSARCAR